MLETITLEDALTHEAETIRHDEPFGVFVFVGHDPAVDLVRDYVDVVGERHRDRRLHGDEDPRAVRRR